MREVLWSVHGDRLSKKCLCGGRNITCGLFTYRGEAADKCQTSLLAYLV